MTTGERLLSSGWGGVERVHTPRGGGHRRVPEPSPSEDDRANELE